MQTGKSQWLENQACFFGDAGAVQCELSHITGVRRFIVNYRMSCYGITQSLLSRI